jgi:predicted lipoprotein with Yx(FWY)xxD motif
LNIRLHLEAFIPEAQAALAAAGWDGDRYAYLRDARGNKTLVMRSVWDSEGEAEEFFDAYVTFVGQKSDGAWDLVLAKDTDRQWEGDHLSLYLGRNGSGVLIIIAPDPAVVQKVRAAFPDFSG